MRFYLLDAKNYLEASSLLLSFVAMLILNLQEAFSFTKHYSTLLLANAILSIGLLLLWLSQVETMIPC